MRKDYFRDKWTYVSPKRGKRKFETKERKDIKSDSEDCFFCPGNESKTPPEISRFSKGRGWQVRVFPNKFSIVGNEYPLSDVWETQESYGNHEIIVETPDHNKDIKDLDHIDIIKFLKVYAERVASLEKDKKIKWVQIFKNFGREAGASLIHSHVQLIAVSKVPAKIKEKSAASHLGNCAYCWLVGVERESERLVFENDSFVLIIPFAPTFEYEMWIVAKEHLKGFDDFNQKTFEDLAQALKLATSNARLVSDNYNYMVFSGLNKKDFHFHIEIVPRMEHKIKAGFEMGTGYSVMTESPESMVENLREEAKSE